MLSYIFIVSIVHSCRRDLVILFIHLVVVASPGACVSVLEHDTFRIRTTKLLCSPKYTVHYWIQHLLCFSFCCTMLLCPCYHLSLQVHVHVVLNSPSFIFDRSNYSCSGKLSSSTFNFHFIHSLEAVGSCQYSLPPLIPRLVQLRNVHLFSFSD